MNPAVPGPAAVALSEYLRRSKLSQRDLAERLQCSESWVSYLLSGTKPPGLTLAKRIQKLTGIPAGDWVSE